VRACYRLRSGVEKSGFDTGPDAMDLRALVVRDLVVGLPQHLLDQPPRIMAVSNSERAALGYLHGNCGRCNNDQGPPWYVGLYCARRRSGIACDRGDCRMPSEEAEPGRSPEAVNRHASQLG
jgi:hypothetical protein